MKGRTAIVTGSTSGIGLAIAHALAAAGANVVVNGRGSEEENADLIRSISRHGTRVVYDPANMLRHNQIAEMIERELTRVVKELMTLNRVRGIMERQRQIPTQNILQNLTETDLVKLTTLLEDDKVGEELYVQKLDTLLGVVNDPAYESQDIGNEGLEVLKTWEQMDEGELDFEEGLKEASGKEKAGGQKEQKEEEKGEAEPA